MRRMKTRAMFAVVVPILIIFNHDCVGADAPVPSTGTATTIKNDQTNYEGDRVRFPNDLLVEVEQTDGKQMGIACLPAKTPLIGQQAYSAPTKAADGTSTTVTGSKFRVNTTKFNTCNPDRLPKDTVKIPKLENADIVEITSDQLSNNAIERYGLTYGALAIPFKYHFGGNKDVTGAATVGAYFGYRATADWNSLALVGFAGYSNISVAQTVNQKSTTQNLSGVGFGVALVGTVKGNFQLGAVLGMDHVGSSAGYTYNDKPWLAFELGYSFLQ